MKRILTLFVSLAFICVFFIAPAQAGAQQNRVSIFDLIQEGKFALAVSILRTEIDAPNRTAGQRGRAYALLGYAYKEQGNFESAQRAFDHAFRWMDATGDHSSDYAATLDFYAGLLMSTGDLDSAAKALHEAAGVNARLANHVGLAKIYTHTAELDIERKKYKQARKELASARAETAVTNQPAGAIDPDIDAADGWLATSTGKFHEGVAAYSAALEECRNQFGDGNAITGWSYLLLGKAQGLDHDQSGAVRSMEKGLAILKQTVGTNNIRYLAGELAYSELLDDAGSHAEASRLSTAANQSLKSLGVQPCAGCTVNVWTLRH